MASNLPDPDTLSGRTGGYDITDVVFTSLFGDNFTNLFGGGSGSADGHWTTLYNIFGFYNSVILVLVGIYLSYVAITGAAGTAYEGTFLGRRHHTFWTPFRSVIAVSTLIPVPGLGGVSLLQALILAMIVPISMSANYVLSEVGKDMANDTTGLVRLVDERQVEMASLDLAGSVLESEIIQASLFLQAYENYVPDSAPIVSWWDEDWAVTRLFKNAWNNVWGNEEQGDHSAKHSGEWIFEFQPPEGMMEVYKGADFDALKENIGNIRIPCIEGGPNAAEGGPDAVPYAELCNSRYQAIQNLIDNLWPIAVRIVRREGVSPEEFQSVSAQFRQEIVEANLAFMETSGDKTYQAAQEFFGVLSMDAAPGQDAGGMGWMMLGSYYYAVASFQEHITSVAKRMPEVTPVNYDALSAFAGGDLKTSLEAANAYMMRAVATDPTSHLPQIQNSESSGILDRIERWFSNIFLDIHDSAVEGLMTGDPLINLKTMGNYITSAAEVGAVAWMAILGAEAFLPVNQIAGALKNQLKTKTENMGMVSKMLSYFGNIGTALANFISMILAAILLPIFLLGLFLAYYLPSVPFFMWFLGVYSWIVRVVEMLFLAPMWSFAHAIADGEGMAGDHAKHGYVLILPIVFQPMLMVGTFFFTFYLIRTIAWLVGAGWMIHVRYMNADNMVGPVGMIAMIFMISTFMVVLIDKIFGLITFIPDNLTKWIGQQFNGLGEESTLSHVQRIIVGNFNLGGRTYGSLLSKGTDRHQ